MANRAVIDLIIGVTDNAVSYESLVEWFRRRITRQPLAPEPPEGPAR